MQLNPWKLPLSAILLVVVPAVAGFLFAGRMRTGKTVAHEHPRMMEHEEVSGVPSFSKTAPTVEPVPFNRLIAPPGAIKNELLLRFPNAAALQSFLDQATRAGGRILGIIPRLNTVRVGFDDPAQEARLRGLAPQEAEIGFNYIVAPPDLPDPAKQDTGGPYQAFGDQALAWLGVPADNAKWGSGVKVALLDTGVTDVPGLSKESISQLDLAAPTSGAVDDLRHGTALASIIAGTSPDARGIAPGSQLLSIRVLDENGIGNSFTVAQGIMDAVDNGARIISMSLGSSGDSSILSDAVAYALAHDVAVVAAVGNEGIGSVSYPAKYPGVIGVTAVDANGQRAQFANYGREVAISAPGIGVSTPWSADKVLDVSGTSAAVPFVSGALAAILSQNPGMTVGAATALLVQYANDAGAPGPDPMFGAGILSVERVLNRNTPGIIDAALADVYYNPTGAGPMAVTVQNRGTTALLNVKLEVAVAQTTKSFNISTLGVGEVKSETIAVDPAQLSNPDGMPVRSRVSVGAAPDAKPGNDTKAVVLRLKQSGAK